jgi:hypothetical protein
MLFQMQKSILRQLLLDDVCCSYHSLAFLPGSPCFFVLTIADSLTLVNVHMPRTCNIEYYINKSWICITTGFCMLADPWKNTCQSCTPKLMLGSWKWLELANREDFRKSMIEKCSIYYLLCF